MVELIKQSKEYVLPKIITIGNESVGKTTLLENIAKTQIFPKDTKQCTKCPTHIIMSRGESKYSISYDDTVIEIKDKNDILKETTKYMNSLDTITENILTVNITEPNLLQLELDDLPGIVSYPQNMADITIGLCKKYMNDKNAIVLCVVPATTTRLTSCPSISLIIEMKMEKNCILALTMADHVQVENIEDLIIKRIIKTSDEVKNLNFAGYNVVVNRTHNSMNNLTDNDIYEEKWFNVNILQYIPEEYAQYEKVIRENITISNLITRIDGLYTEFIVSTWKPRILKLLDNRLSEYFKYHNTFGEKDTETSIREIEYICIYNYS